MTRVPYGACSSPSTQIIAILSLIFLVEINTSSISNPHRSDSEIGNVIPDYFDRKSFKAYHNSTPHDLKEIPIITYNSPDPECNVGFKLAWSSTVGSPVYASPVIFPSGKDGEKQILLSTFHQHIEILGHDGYKPSGWPLSFEDSTFQGSPMLYDIDGDGTNDVGVVDKAGNMFWIRIGEYGQYMEDYHIQVPKLKIKKDWAVGLDPKFTDNYVIMSMFDHKTDRNSRKYSYEGPPTKGIFAKNKGDDGKAVPSEKKISPDDLGRIRQDSYPELNAYNKDKQGGKESNKGEKGVKVAAGSRRLLSIPEEDVIENKEEVKEGVIAEAREVPRDAPRPDAPADHNNNRDNNGNNGGKVDTEITDSQLMHRLAEENQAEAARLQEIKNFGNKEKEFFADPGHPLVKTTLVPPIITAELPVVVEVKKVDEKVVEPPISELTNNIPQEEKAKEEKAQEGKVNEEKVGQEIKEEIKLENKENKDNEDALRAKESLPIEEESGRPLGETADDYIPDGNYGRTARNFDDASGGYYSGQRGGNSYNDSNFVFVDSHVLGSPVLVDIDNDGIVEVLVAVSYYFDKDEYAGRELDFDPSMYVAGGLACWNLQSQDWTWLVHLDLTTDHTKFKAIIYSTPTVADLDGDGRSEIVLGTSMGLLYLLDGDNGFVKRFFPMQFHEIQAQVAVADVMGGAGLEIIVADMGGTLAVVDLQGEILWDANLSGTLPHTPTVGDVDGDGQMDIAVVAASADGTSHLWVVRGDTGKPLPGYPMSLPVGAIASASVLLVDLHDYRTEAAAKTSKMSKDKVLDPSMAPWMGHKYGYEPGPSPVQLEALVADTNSTEKKKTGYERRMAQRGKNALNKGSNQGPKSKGLHIIVPSFDGHIYVIEGALQCAERIDIGEHIYSTPLMTDMTGDGNLDLVVGTLSGQVHMLQSTVPHHPLNSWSSFPNGRMNGFTHGVMGVSVPQESRMRLSRADFITYNRTMPIRDPNSTEEFRFDLIIARALLSVTFDIWDDRKVVENRRYKVTMTKGTNKQSVLATIEYDAPGRYTVLVPVYPPEIFVLVIGMTNEHGQYFEDTVPLEVGTFFYVWMKYILLLPTLLMSVPLLLMRKKAMNR